MPADFKVHLTGNMGPEVFPDGWPRTLRGNLMRGQGGAPDRYVAHTYTPYPPASAPRENAVVSIRSRSRAS